MRLALIAALAASTVTAQDVFLTGDALQQDIARCVGGCIVFDRQEAENLERGIQALMMQAFQAGKQEGGSGCRL